MLKPLVVTWYPPPHHVLSLFAGWMEAFWAATAAASSSWYHVLRIADRAGLALGIAVRAGWVEERRDRQLDYDCLKGDYNPLALILILLLDINT